MAIIKINHSKNNCKQLELYLEKNNRAVVKSCFDCRVDWANHFNEVKQDFAKETGRQVTHIVQSFENEPNNPRYTPKIINRLGQELVYRFLEQGYQAVIITHTDTDNLHNHIVINTVNELTGKKLRLGKQDLQKIKEINDDLCEEMGLAKCQHKFIQKAYDENYLTLQEKYSWKEDLKNRLEKVFSRGDLTDTKALQSALSEQGVNISKLNLTNETHSITYSIDIVQNGKSVQKKARIIEYLDTNGNVVSTRNKLGQYACSDIINFLEFNKEFQMAKQKRQARTTEQENYKVAKVDTKDKNIDKGWGKGI